MARPSRVKSPKHAQFEVYADEDDATTSSLHDRNVSNHGDIEDDVDEENGAADDKMLLHDGIDNIMEQDVDYEDENGSILDDIEASLLEVSANTLGEQTDTSADADDEYRRESAMTTASISSMPDSTVFDTDHGAPQKFPYTPQSARPTFRHDSLRRIHTPTSSSRSPGKRQSVLHLRSSRTGTPRSARKTRQQELEEKKHEFPLVLLHLTLLPISLRWSEASLQTLLPPNTLRDLHLLRSKVSDTILQRGILVPHPRGEYELLEERLLEALELRQERVTKCGHYLGVGRSSVGSSSEEEGDGEGSIHSTADSGVDISPPGLEGDTCSTCRHQVKATGPAIASTGSKWSIKIYAANGLMRSSAWSAAWEEMERVDVEILPWISEEVRKQLDAAAEKEEEEDEKQRMRTLVEEQVRIVHERELGRRAEEQSRPRSSLPKERQATFEGQAPQQSSQRSMPLAMNPDPLPQVFKPADVPLSILLRNYIYLLAQDKRNLAIFILAIMAAWLSFGAVLRPTPFPGVPVLNAMTERSAASTMSGQKSGSVAEFSTSVEKMLTCVTPVSEHVLKPFEAVLGAEDGNSAPGIGTTEQDSSESVCRNPMSTTELFARREEISSLTA
ncbi:hypothetical protein TI39_contig397g00005 [Zymoseptoria brevis]|uniref:Uncharacterized protein n=1 Tax=Zymoseptoria brevis TaxID=1047168 RepID=A0A0F4GR69_9PEZI|nr:hypothetical protein TI39_contig397g00005 [Zymoseptoria brevis]